MASWVYGFSARGEDENYGGECVLEQTSHLIASEKQRACFYDQGPSPISFIPSSIKLTVGFSPGNMAVQKVVGEHF
jgi:hypothetical protein